MSVSETTPQQRTVLAEPPPQQQRAASRKAGWVRRAPLVPALVFIVVMTQLPFATTIVISFISWNALRPDERGFAGFSNYAQVFTDANLRSSVVTTIVLTVVVVGVSLVLGLLIALLLDRQFFGRGAVRTLMIAPFLVVPVAAALLWKHAILNPSYGLVNGVLTWVWGLFGSSSPPQVAWLTQYPLISIELALIWQWTPFMMLILLAGLQSRPADAFEAAKMDGASPFQAFRYITLPHLRRYIDLGATLGAIFIVQNFDAVFTMTSGALGTANLPYTIYQTFFVRQDYGLAAAQGVIVVIGTIVVATFALRSASSLLKEDS
ncbi:carbohydrate ABC transporter permease [uncultured Pseudokineococcus sp.]|uniref:carbohydrate ABC transporter permease n=1 Tax=uncultured Pseudokineococcus sp. TaxID=1642928 RepID=UPI00262D0A9F|nr:sugar ABC transporter permease [uncultured Pseudokineococcus sp.]